MADVPNLAPLVNAIRDLQHDVVSISGSINQVDVGVGPASRDLTRLATNCKYLPMPLHQVR